MTPESATVTINRGTEAMTDGLASIRSRFPFIIGCFPDPVLDSVLIDFPITKARMAEDMALLRQADVTVEPIEIVISHLMEDGRNPDYPSVVESHRLYTNLANEVRKRASSILYLEEKDFLMIGQALLINRLTIEASSDENEEITASQTSEDDFARRMKQIEALSRLYIIAIQKGRLIEQADLVARFELATRQAKDLYPGKVEDIACLAPKGPPTGTSLASSAGWVADMTPAERHGLGDGE